MDEKNVPRARISGHKRVSDYIGFPSKSTDLRDCVLITTKGENFKRGPKIPNRKHGLLAKA